MLVIRDHVRMQPCQRRKLAALSEMAGLEQVCGHLSRPPVDAEEAVTHPGDVTFRDELRPEEGGVVEWHARFRHEHKHAVGFIFQGGLQEQPVTFDQGRLSEDALHPAQLLRLWSGGGTGCCLFRFIFWGFNASLNRRESKASLIERRHRYVDKHLDRTLASNQASFRAQLMPRRWLHQIPPMSHTGAAKGPASFLHIFQTYWHIMQHEA
jgi:hypothetical protein